MISKSLIPALLILFSSFNWAQDSLYQHVDDSFFSRKNISVMAISGFYAFSIIEGYYSWWKGDSHPFHFYDKVGSHTWFNEKNSLGIDKVGHFYTSYFLYHFQKDVFLWGGYSPEFSKWSSAALSSTFAIIIEIGDAFSSFGFDYQDLVFNLCGVGYGLLQDEYEFLRNFNFKWSFYPKAGLSFPPKFTHHYDDHIYWLTADVHKLLGKNNFWPKYIQPAIGYSVNNNGNEREFIIGLDFNLNFLFEKSNDDIALIGKTIQWWHFPSPGIKYSPDSKPTYKLLLWN